MKTTKKILLISLIFIGIILLSTNVQAASASISASKTSATAGDSVTINVSVNAAAWNLRVSGNGISGDSIVGYDSDGNNVSTSRSFTLNTSSAGTYTITLSGDVTDGVTEANSPVSKSVTVTVTPPAAPSSSSGGGSSSSSSSSSSSGSRSSSSSSSNTSTNSQKQKEEEKKSSDATLKDLIVEEYDLYPEFDAGTKEYNVKVPNDVTSIKIVPTVNDSKAKFDIEGNADELEVGENEFIIKVTAENGEENEYKIIVTREREPLTVTSIKLTYIDEEGNTQEIIFTPEFDPEIKRYEVANLSYLISKLDIEVLANLEDAVIEITGNEELQEGENLITITVTMPSETEEEDEVVTYEFVVNKEPEPKLSLFGRIKKWFKGLTGTIGTWFDNNKYTIVNYSLVFCSVAMIGLTIYLVIDYKKYRKLIEKVAEISKINNNNEEFVTETGEVDSRNISNNEEIVIQEEVEPEEEKEEKDTRPRGRHF